jgi:ATP-dependent helicase/nuclease subunit A
MSLENQASKKRSANIEQLLAIEKKDGVILSAGAGSGKTFVIIEHILALIMELKSKLKNLDQEKWSQEIGSELSKIVLMTFTKKASGEMSVRLINKLESLLNENPNDEFLRLVFQNINRIHISTIHGFCHRLLGLGIWPEFPGEIELLDSFRFKEKIKKLFLEWVSIEGEKLSNLYLAHTTDLLQAMIDIFNSPELRILWSTPLETRSFEQELDKFILNWLELKNFEVLFKPVGNISSEPEKMKKGGYQLLHQFENIFNESGSISSLNIERYIDLFDSLKTFPRETKDMNEYEILYREEIKSLYEFLKNNRPNIEMQRSHFDIYLEWEHTLFRAFNFIQANYLRVPGFAFSDLEYFVYSGLKKDSSQAIKHFDYFIVDEFQDTSAIQFEILRMLIDENFSKLFCVGDKKQAIYGFRGGELQVFNECSRLLGESANLSLKSNYRSGGNIVKFNNAFFEEVLPAGMEFIGQDRHSVEMEPQKTPIDKDTLGSVNSYKIDLNTLDEAIDVDFIEACGLLEVIKLDLANPEIKNIVILYRKLKPSRYLIDLLRQNEISYSAQIKIDFNDDPIIALFKNFLLLAINYNDIKIRKSSETLIYSLLKLIGVESFLNIDLEGFYLSIKTIGIANSFWKVLIILGIQNSYYKLNAEFIESLCLIGKGDLGIIFNLLDKTDDSYSADMLFGKNKKVHIMSTHASKGLEFDSVLIGGLHTNGRAAGFKSKVGKMPKSFRWKKSFDQKVYNKSLDYILEGEFLTLKEFSESKRLFYVACTRAIKKLNWVDVSINAEEQTQKNAWIVPLRLFTNNQVNSIKLENIQINKFEKDISIIQKDSLGLEVVKSNLAVGVISELSVTRLSTLAQCPFKFYLKNICKIPTPDFISEALEELDEDEIIRPQFFSSKDRGTKIHFEISKMLKSKMEYTSKTDFKEQLEWIKNEINNFSAQEIISEEEFKFSFFGQMITSIPDAILVTAGSFQVLDFKTGTRHVENENAYWFQLMSYAFGFGLLKSFDQNSEVSLHLMYVDQKDMISKSFKLKEIRDELFKVWSLTSKLYQINQTHCSFCEYRKMCKSACLVASP